MNVELINPWDFPMTTFTETDVEEAALAWLSGVGWQVLHGPDIAPDTANAERG